MTLKIYLPEARQKQGQVYAYAFSGKIPLGFGLEAGGPDRLDIEAEIRISGDRAFLKGNLQAELPANCSRCLKEFTRRVSVDFSETFTLVEEISTKVSPAVLASEAANELTVRGDYLYLEEYFRQILSLGLGCRPLCREDCRGICSVCGSDLNMGRCDCAPGEKKDSRFKVLEKYFSQSEGQPKPKE